MVIPKILEQDKLGVLLAQNQLKTLDFTYEDVTGAEKMLLSSTYKADYRGYGSVPKKISEIR